MAVLLVSILWAGSGLAVLGGGYFLTQLMQ
jgi:hypothetical protein